MPGFLRTPPPNARVDAAAGSATQLQANSSLGLDKITHIMAEEVLEHLVLGEEELLELDDLVEHRVGVGGLSALVGGGGEHVLADDDHREEHQLEEGL